MTKKEKKAISLQYGEMMEQQTLIITLSGNQSKRRKKYASRTRTLLHMQGETGETRASKLIFWGWEAKLLCVCVCVNSGSCGNVKHIFYTDSLSILTCACTCSFWLLKHEMTFYQLFVYNINEFWHWEHSEKDYTKLSLNLRKSFYFQK